MLTGILEVLGVVSYVGALWLGAAPFSIGGLLKVTALLLSGFGFCSAGLVVWIDKPRRHDR